MNTEQLLKQAEKRHKWEQLGHRYNFEKQCKVCGCIKNEKVIGNTFYELNGERYNYAPPCKN